MADYCSPRQVENRLKTAGYLNVADEDEDGLLSPEELAAHITTGIEWAGGKIDYYVVNRTPAYDPSVLRSSPNSWCSQRAVDLAAWHAATNGGRDCPESLQAARDEAIEELKGIMDDGKQIPGQLLHSDFTRNNHEVFHIVSEYST